MPAYTMDDLDDLEEQAESSGPMHQIPALALVSGLLESNRIPYGVMGGMNFYLRGSQRVTGDVDIAVDNPPRMDALLNIFNGHPNIYRPGNRMQWASGVARLFVRIQDRTRRSFYVQVDLKPKGSEGNLIPTNLAASVERIPVDTIQCQGLTIGPLVAAKIKAHYGRETRDDYHDLRFVCTSATYAPMVRQAATSFREEWKECFLEKILEDQPELEQAVRWALRMERSPSPEGKGKGKNTDARGGGGDGRGGGSGGGGSSRDRSPKDGDQSSDRYWTYSSREKNWYHRHSDGNYSWRSQSSGNSVASKTTSRSTDKTASRSTDKTASRSTKKTTPRDGEQSKDKYWTYDAKRKEWYHRHSDGKYSVQKA